MAEQPQAGMTEEQRQAVYAQSIAKLRMLLNNPEKFNEVCKYEFDLVDKDHSGFIDLNEFTELMLSASYTIGREYPSEEEIKKAFDEVDKDHSGHIDPKEFEVVVKQQIEMMIKAYEGK